MDWQIALRGLQEAVESGCQTSGHKGKAEMFFLQQHLVAIWEFLTIAKRR